MATYQEPSTVQDAGGEGGQAGEAPGTGKPRIPARFFAKSPLLVAALIARGASLWLLSGLGAWALIRAEGPALPTTLGVIGLFLVAGQGVHLLGILGHDGSHGNLAKSRWRSAIAGILVSSTVPLHTDVGFSVLHAEHHRWLNTARDPDVLLMAGFRSYLSRLLFLRPAITRRSLRTTLRLAFGRWPADQKIRLNLSRSDLVVLAWFNLACSLLWLSSYVAVTLWSPLAGLCFVWGPVAGGSILSGARVVAEHAGTGVSELEASRSYVHPIFTFLFGGTNYHLAHHMFPTVPLYRLPEFHRWLDQNGMLAGAPLQIDRTFFGYWRYPAMPYPEASPDQPIDGALQPADP